MMAVLYVKAILPDKQGEILDEGELIAGVTKAGFYRVKIGQNNIVLLPEAMVRYFWNGNRWESYQKYRNKK